MHTVARLLGVVVATWSAVLTKCVLVGIFVGVSSCGIVVVSEMWNCVVLGLYYGALVRAVRLFKLVMWAWGEKGLGI